MRDKLKDEHYFQNKIVKIKSRIAEYQSILSEEIQQHPDNKQGILNGQLVLEKNYEDIFNCCYSLGETRENLKPIYKKMLEYYLESLSSQNSYTRLIHILSIALLLDEDKEPIYLLEKNLKSEWYNDWFVNYLLAHIDSNWQNKSETFSFPGFYEPLKTIAERKDIALLADYNKNYWYKSHSETYWYNAHQSKRNTYCGYWDYEAAALAKILQLDCASLKETQYFPYDLI